MERHVAVFVLLSIFCLSGCDEPGASAGAPDEPYTSFFTPLPAAATFPEDNAFSEPKRALGEFLFWDPILSGRMNVSCASCHEENYGNYIRADHLSQGQINGFPTYRLKNAKLNGVHSRFRGCVRDTRAETYAKGSDEFIALELYVKSRSNGLSVEGPSVRN